MKHPNVTLGHKIKRVIFGRIPTQSIAVQRTSMAWLVYAASALTLRLDVYFGFSDWNFARWLTIYMLTGPTIFYLLVRSGWSRRLRDSSLTMPQNLFALSALIFAYPTVGPMRALIFLLVALLPLFGFLAMTPRQTRLLAWLSVLGFGTMMACLARFAPQQFEPRAEALHFIFAAICLPCIAFLLSRIGYMRLNVRAQRTELEDAKARLEAVAARDQLTGLFNRQYIVERLSLECRSSHERQNTSCVSLIDLDHFKHINDALGHAAGDEALRHFANVAQSILPNSCEIGRWGGEEFLVLMPGTSASVAADLIDRLRATLKDRGHIPMILAEVDLTFSAGLAVGSMGNPDQILEIADRALYQAKATGRNRTVTMTPDDRGPTKLIPITVAT